MLKKSLCFLTASMLFLQMFTLAAFADSTDAELEADYLDAPKAFFLEVTWGDLDGSVPFAVEETDWSGEIQVTGAEMKVRKEIKFEGDWDMVVEEESDLIGYYSKIYSHFDGLLVKVFPTEGEDLTFTFSNEYLGEKTYRFDELREGVIEDLGDGYKMAIRLHNPLKYKPFYKGPVFILARWGNLDGTVDLEKPVIDYDGSVEVDGLAMRLVSPILFEFEQDFVNDYDAKVINFSSGAGPHWDGLLIRLQPIEESLETFRLEEVVVEDEDDGTVTMDDMNVSATPQSAYDIYEDVRNPWEGSSLTVTLGTYSKTFKSVDDFGVYDIGDGNQLEVRNLLSYVRDLNPERYRELLASKILIMHQCQQVYDFSKQWEEDTGENLEELVNICDQLVEYNFDGKTSVKIVIMLKVIVKMIEDGTITEEDINNWVERNSDAIENLKNEARENKYESGIIPFKDVDDTMDVWYADFVAQMVEEGIIKGYSDENGNPLGEYRPGNNVTIAEVLKIALLTAGHVIGDEAEPDDIPDPATAERLVNHWAKNHFYLAMRLGLDIAPKQGLNPDRLATRAEVIHLILQVFEIDVPEATSSPYSDVSELDKYMDDIVYATELGIVSGDSDADTFRPNESVNRAEVAKIINNVIELLVME